MTTGPNRSVGGPQKRPQPRGWQKRMMDLPVWFYRRGYGRLFGKRTVVLVHRGRKTGTQRQTALALLDPGPVEGEYRVQSGWGRGSDWFRNLEANPPEGLWVGSARLAVTHRVLEPAEAADLVRRHLMAHPRVSARINPSLWQALQAGGERFDKALRDYPVVAFRPVHEGSVNATEARPVERVIRPAGIGVVETLEALGLIVAHLVLTPFIGRRRLHWGATLDEANATLPGDELVPQPKWSYTYAVTVKAAPARVWPWIVQIGQGRGGFYSYQTLENLVGCQIHNVVEILPEHQHPAVGDEVRLHPTTPALRVAIVDPPGSFVIHGVPAEVGADQSFATSTWQLVLTETTNGSTRLLMRGRSDYSPEPLNRLFFGRLPLEPIMFVMSRKMLLEIKRLAEAEYQVIAGPH